ncbi:DUF6477 family protein [Celeribacter indicus]|uniref:Uncharacterized protein n=1 Tax=Celeribacter indicus TaxID=1208324 RepID=A0A0B5DU06_9RHOB|nr:DUF6477 family protein [Celeribacter indicus]AJE46943.1 hypothetical protein P73_2228 [Celeribacter indicus]SDW78044.1 hypothetical protein SAMN05443573_10732 [Celeribacter indicus]
MTDVATLLSNLRRPRLLIRAARLGLADYNRNRDLLRVMRSATVPSPLRAVSALIEEEARIEESRRSGTGAYDVVRHVDLLIALMAEARLLPPAGAPRAPLRRPSAPPPDPGGGFCATIALRRSGETGIRLASHRARA